MIETRRAVRCCLLALAVLTAAVVADDAPPAPAKEEAVAMPEGPKSVVVLTKPVFDSREPNQRWLLEL